MSNRSLPISVLILTKNEQASISDCVASLSDFDEVVVVDSNSEDATTKLAQDAGARIVKFSWDGKYPKKKQWMLENVATRHPWILMLDADERVTPELVQELRELAPTLAACSTKGFDITLDYVFNNRVLLHGHRVVKRSLLHRDFAHFPIIDDLAVPGMGEVEGHYQPVVSGKVAALRGHILHNDQDPVRTWFDRHNRYSDWEAYIATSPLVAKNVNQSRSRQGRIFAKVPFKPVAFFVYDFIVKQGFRDGRAGFNYAIALAWYYWLTDVKIREAAQRRDRETLR